MWDSITDAEVETLIREAKDAAYDDLAPSSSSSSAAAQDNDAEGMLHYFSSELPWSLLGIAMFAQAITSGSADDGDSPFTSPLQRPSLYSPTYLYARLSPFLLPLLRNEVLSTVEGLRLAGYIGMLVCFCELTIVRSSHNLRCGVSLLR
jgi:hypothetical protein